MFSGDFTVFIHSFIHSFCKKQLTERNCTIKLENWLKYYNSSNIQLHIFYLHTHTFIRNRNEPYLPLPSQPQLVLIYRPRRDGRLSRPWCEVAQAEIRTRNLSIANPALYHTATSVPTVKEPSEKHDIWVEVLSVLYVVGFGRLHTVYFPVRVGFDYWQKPEFWFGSLLFGFGSFSSLGPRA